MKIKDATGEVNEAAAEQKKAGTGLAGARLPLRG
jgi:hypothetical protein